MNIFYLTEYVQTNAILVYNRRKNPDGILCILNVKPARASDVKRLSRASLISSAPRPHAVSDSCARWLISIVFGCAFVFLSNCSQEQGLHFISHHCTPSTQHIVET